MCNSVSKSLVRFVNMYRNPQMGNHLIKRIKKYLLISIHSFQWGEALIQMFRFKKCFPPRAENANNSSVKTQTVLPNGSFVLCVCFSFTCDAEQMHWQFENVCRDLFFFTSVIIQPSYTLRYSTQWFSLTTNVWRPVIHLYNDMWH